MLTWDQFKEYVDNQLAVAGRDGSIPLEYIKYFSGGRDHIETLIGREVDEQKLQVWNV